MAECPIPGKLMGRRVSHEWPAKNPDLTVSTLQLFSQVHSTKPRNMKELEERIREALTSILQELLVKSVDAVHGRL